MSFNDPLYPDQWYLFDADEGGVKVRRVWDNYGYDGSGVGVGIFTNAVLRFNLDVENQFNKVFFMRERRTCDGFHCVGVCIEVAVRATAPIS